MSEEKEKAGGRVGGCEGRVEGCEEAGQIDK